MIIVRILGSALMLTAAVPNATAPEPAAMASSETGTSVTSTDQAQPVQDRTLRCNAHCGWDVFHALH